MALAASPRYRPYVNSPGANPAAAARFTNAAAQFYPPAYGGGTTTAAAPTTTTTTTAPKVPQIDYQKLLADDPILGQALAGYKASDIANLAGLQAQQQRALVQYGRVPSMSLPGSPNIDETTRQLAAQNTQSTVANIDRAYKLAQQGSTADLAARGLLRSGAYGQHAAENLQAYQGAGYQADQQLLDYLQGIYSGYLSQQQTLQQSGTTATTDALDRLITLIKAGLITGTTTPTNDTTPPPTSAPMATPWVVAPTQTTPAYVPEGVADPYRAALTYAATARRPVAV